MNRLSQSSNSKYSSIAPGKPMPVSSQEANDYYRAMLRNQNYVSTGSSNPHGTSSSIEPNRQSVSSSNKDPKRYELSVSPKRTRVQDFIAQNDKYKYDQLYKVEDGYQYKSKSPLREERVSYTQVPARATTQVTRIERVSDPRDQLLIDQLRREVGYLSGESKMLKSENEELKQLKDKGV